jgi:hypothetical protein
VNNCGNCKWLTGGVEPHHRKKDGEMKQRYNHTVFTCTVPFTMPAAPACMDKATTHRRMMAPYYGEGCAFHAPYGDSQP